MVRCAVADCKADRWSLQSTLASLDFWCIILDEPISSDVIADAYAAVSASPSETTRRPASPTSSRKSEYKSSKGDDETHDFTSTISSTWTKTTTDSSGNTLQVIVPVVIGPSGVSTGVMSTSTLGGEATPTNAPSVASPLPTASAAPAPSAPTQALSSTVAAESEETESPARGNGSPFENMQADATRWVVSCPLLGLGLLAMILVRP